MLRCTGVEGLYRSLDHRPLDDEGFYSVIERIFAELAREMLGKRF